MAGKGSGRRLKQIKDIEDKLKWELWQESTPADRKDDINKLFGIKQMFQIELANINTTEARKDILRKIIDGQLPYLMHPETRVCNYFPWSEEHGYDY